MSSKELRQTRISCNQCVRCGVELHGSKFKTCEQCIAKNRVHCKNKRHKWMAQNKCVKCGSCDIMPQTKIDRITRYCEECFFKNISNRHFRTTKKWGELKSIIEKQNYICPYSGVKLTIGVNAWLDHIVARNKNGKTEIGNLQWVHSIVNRMKSDFSEEEFLQFIEAIYFHKIEKK